ncbi:PucR family transcriptional regulator [Clostridium fermenticellae]|uniref:PucR family transcriptional regulator n=1 Tax=Clostridium fermenticellae TaxID=2068654 RepID=A0A386H1X6_9CLOT|nr:PucR family transcriptional regulator [Clostridium fermenticellae]AYD39680.1 PucR family transcriptional regulator [Clostridium fermenticellae]
MSITVENMLKINNFSDFKVIAGHNGLQRKVTSVSVIDAPDVGNWVKGGEFLITTGYCIKDDLDKFVKLIININNSSVSALGIKLNRFIDILPEKAIEIANKLSLPIVQIPIEFTFVEIINPVLSKIINEQAQKLQHSENIHKFFTQLVINGGDTRQIVNTLGDILKGDVAFYDTYSEKKYYIKAYSDKFASDIETMELSEILTKYKNYPINIDKKNYGYIVISDEILRDGKINIYDDIAVEHASTVLKLEIQKKISNVQIEERYKDEFVRDLIINNIKTPEEVKSRSRLYGWNLSSGLVSIIVDIDDFKLRYLKIKDKKKNYTLEETKLIIFESARKVMKKYFDQVVYTTFSDSIVFLIKPLCLDNHNFFKQLRKVCEEICAKTLNENKFTVTIGVGNYELSVMNIYKSFENAKKAVKLGRIIYKCDKVVFFDELGIYKLLSLVYKSDDAKEFYLSNLQELISYDKKNNADLLKTLYYIVRNNWNLKEASKDMYVHYNTIKYRYSKIKELLNIDFKNSEEKTNIVISLKLMEMAE